MGVQLKFGEQVFEMDYVTTNLMSSRKGKITSTHRHPVFHLMYVTKGTGVFEIDGRASVAREGLYFVISPNEWHCFSGDEADPLHNFECTFLLRDAHGEPADIHFFELIAQRHDHVLPPEWKRCPLTVPPIMKPYLIEAFSRMEEAQKTFFSKEHLSVLALDLLMRSETLALQLSDAMQIGPFSSTDAAIDSLKRYLYVNLHHNVTLQEMADFVSFTPNYLCRVFKQRTSDTPIGYLQKLRMRESEKLLLQTDLPVYAIAEKLGYEEVTYFNRVFRNHFGLSPGEFRRSGLSSPPTG